MASGKKSTGAFEAALKRELQSALPSNVADCPASDVLAAYYDRSLMRTERARVDSHLVSCARCQSMMASMARADDRTPVPRTAGGIFWITRILAPLAVVGVIIAIAIGMRTRERTAPEVIALASPPIALKPEIAAPAPPAPKAAAAVQRDLMTPGAPPAVAVAGPPRARILIHQYKTATKKLASPSVESSVPMRFEAPSAPPPPQNAPAEAASEMSRAVGVGVGEGSASVPSASDMSSAPDAAGAGESELTQRSARSEIAEEKSSAPSTLNSNSAPAEAPSTQPAQAASAPAAATLQGPGLSARSVAGTFETAAKASLTNQITSPDATVIWRFGSGGTIMRSGNLTPWLAMHSGVTTDLLAASAPSNDVCWVVGKSGTIVRTLDSGAHWQLINPPSHNNFTSITASDSNNATVSDSNGYRYLTHDGGVTWSAQ